MLLNKVIAIVSLPIVLWAMQPDPANYSPDIGDLDLLAQAAEQMQRQEAEAAPAEGNSPPAIANGAVGGGEGDGTGGAAEGRAAAVDEGQQDEADAQDMSIEIDSSLSNKKRVFKSMQEFTANSTNPSLNTLRSRERKTPRRSEATKSAGEASGSFKDNSHSPAATGGAKKDLSKTRRKNPKRGNLEIGRHGQFDDMPLDACSFDLLAGRGPLPDNSPCSETAQSARETQKVSPISRFQSNQQKGWLPESHQNPLDELIESLVGKGTLNSRGKKPMRNNPPFVADQPNQKIKAKEDKMDKVKNDPRVGTSNLDDQSSSSSSVSRNLQGGNENTSSNSHWPLKARIQDFLEERQRTRKGQIVSDLDSLGSIVNKIGKMNVVSTSSSANMTSEFGTTETARNTIPFPSYKCETASTKSFKKVANKQQSIAPKTSKEIEEAIRKASAESVRVINLNAPTYGFLHTQILTKNLKNKVENFISTIIEKHIGDESTANGVIKKLRDLNNRVIDEIIAEIEDETFRFDVNMKLDQISQDVLDMGQHRMHFLFTYVRLYQKLGNALQWDQLNNQISSADQQQLLNWLNTLVNKLLPTLKETDISQNFSFASEWFEKLGRLENAIELTNFGILLILSPDTWEMFGVERPTKVKGLFEKIGKQKIIKQFDANSDLSSIEQTAQKTWITLDKIGNKVVLEKIENNVVLEKIENNVVLEKIKNIFIKIINKMKGSNAVTLNIQNVPAKIILFLGILDQIYIELANSEFTQLYVPKLAEERANCMHFLEKCLEILRAKLKKYEEGVRNELADLSRLRKPMEGATKKRTKAEGKSADNPIEL
uniref:Uncharacterized protein n=1 Tax=Globodera rostochiensis TaxID=31243 RepID=A0A914I334_GLORO